MSRRRSWRADSSITSSRRGSGRWQGRSARWRSRPTRSKANYSGPAGNSQRGPMNTDNKYQGMLKGFVTVTTLFFMWGFITVSIDPLIAALKAIFSLNYAEAMLTQFAFFMAYFVVSLPAAALIARLGNSKSIIFALGVMVAGCLIVPLATMFDTYSLVLVALF